MHDVSESAPQFSVTVICHLAMVRRSYRSAWMTHRRNCKALCDHRPVHMHVCKSGSDMRVFCRHILTCSFFQIMPERVVLIQKKLRQHLYMLCLHLLHLHILQTLHLTSSHITVHLDIFQLHTLHLQICHLHILHLHIFTSCNF